MNATDVLQTLGQTLGSTASVKSVFGEPIHGSGKTVVPVARVGYGFGGGFGSGKNPQHENQQGEGGGGGGGVRAVPAGVLEITESATRFVPFTDVRRDMVRCAPIFLAGVAVGSLIFRRRRT